MMSDPVTLEQLLDNRLKNAMRARDARVSACIRMVKTKVMERRTAKGFAGKVDDALVRDVIGAYARMLKKGLEEFEAAGSASGETVDQLRFELDYLAEFLPRTKSEEETRAIVREALAREGITDPKQAGRAMGSVMKLHKGDVDAELVKRLVAEALAVG